MSIKKTKKSEPEYPPLLKEMVSPPGEIFYKGELPKESETCIAIVGTRRARKEGLATARKIAEDFARSGVSVVSGLALGIDGAAHKGALDGKGKTFAVLGVGIDRVYPAKHHGLAQKILKNGGGIISEYEPGTKSYPSNFLDRNRIISGLCVATIVVEAPTRSGSLSTARHALDQGREVFVTPGAAQDKNYKGSHQLIRDGARLVTSAKEILEDLGIETTNHLQPSKKKNLGATEKAVINALNNGAMTAEEIIKSSGIPAEKIQNKLGMLVLDGIIREEQGKYYL